MKLPLHIPFAERWLNAYERYRYSRLIHAVRLGMAVLFATAVARAFHLKHGEWIGMTVFVVLGMLQFQGAIYSKAVERMLGTVIGLGAGLAVLWLNQHYFHGGLPFYLTVGAASAAAGWAAEGKNGYIPMLAGLTMCMLIGDNGTEWLDSRRMTRERLEQNMIKMRQINARMVKSRSHLSATSGESHISPAMMEAMQHAHRKIVNSTELLLNTAAKLSPPDVSAEERSLLDSHFQRLQRDLRLTARLLKGHYARRVRIDTDINPRLGRLAQHLPFEWQGFLWLGTNMRMEVAALAILLQRTRRRWLDTRELQRLRAHLMERRANVSDDGAV